MHKMPKITYPIFTVKISDFLRSVTFIKGFKFPIQFPLCIDWADLPEAKLI